MKKISTSMFLALSLLAMAAGPVFAQDITTTPLTGTVQSVTPETDPTTNTISTVSVSFTDDTGTVQTVRLSLETAAALGLVTLTTDPATLEVIVTVNDGVEGSFVSIDPATVIADTSGEDLHPVGSALSDFFSTLLGVDYDTIMTNHQEGTGFGVIAQALWMTNALDGDSKTFQAILDAKTSGDYSAITLPDGSIPTNWGQFRKAVFDDKENAKNNLGSVKSGRAEDELSGEDPGASGSDADTLLKEDKGNGNDKEPGNANLNNGKDKGGNKDKGKGKNK